MDDIHFMFVLRSALTHSLSLKPPSTHVSRLPCLF